MNTEMGILLSSCTLVAMPKAKSESGWRHLARGIIFRISRRHA